MRKNAKFIQIVLTIVGLVIVHVAMAPIAYSAGQNPKTLGNDVLVGSFEIHVQIQRRIVTVMDRGGTHAAVVPSTQLVASFVNWDPRLRTASISVAIRNIGTVSLFGPLRAVVLEVAPPTVLAANPDSGVGPGSWRWIYSASLLGGSSVLSPLLTSGAKEWNFSSAFAMDFQLDVQILAGVPLPPGIGATIESPDGTSITVQPNAIPFEALIDINSVPASTITAPLGTLPFIGAVYVTFQPSIFGGSTLPPSEPLQISIPAPAVLPSAQFIIAQQLLVDFIGGSAPGLREQLAPVDTASFAAGKIVTNATIFPGIFGGGLYVFVADTGSGFVTGNVSDASGPRPGVVVSNNTNTLVSITNPVARYTLFISGGPFNVTGFDPFRGSSGTASGNIATSGSTVAADLFLTSLAAPPITRDGIRNGGFERGELTSWTATGAALVRQQLGPTSTGVIIRPTEGQWMADINTGAGAVGGVGSSLKQQFIVPAGVRTLRLDFNFVSEEFPEFVGTIFNDAFRAIITTPNGQSTFAQVTVNQSGGFTLIGDCFFPGGDNTCGQTGWRGGSVDLSAFAGTNTPITVELLFTANDAGDNIFDTHALIDNIRFSTLWVDATTISGANASTTRIQKDILSATEILSQAGINARLRNFQTVADPGGLLDTDITWTTECRPFLLCLIGLGQTKGVPTAEEFQLMGLARSATGTDVNAYYVGSMTENGMLGSAAGLAVGPDDFHDIQILTNAGVILEDRALGNNLALAHEFGHLLISPDNAGSTLEHCIGPGNFLSGGCGNQVFNGLGVLTRTQSSNINRAGAPLLVP